MKRKQEKGNSSSFNSRIQVGHTHLVAIREDCRKDTRETELRNLGRAVWFNCHVNLCVNSHEWLGGYKIDSRNQNHPLFFLNREPVTYHIGQLYMDL